MFKKELALVPHLPGSYQMYNSDNIIIYVGKAKDLRNRLSSYFNGKVTGKTLKMVSEVKYFKYIITNSELESFILELNLIKKYDPKYNILLKDDKSYPYIEYINSPYPKLKVSRYLYVKKNKNKVLFGPYPNAYAARRVVNLLNRLYPLKKCDGMPKDVCLFYHINECLGYCTKNINMEQLNNMEKEILSFLGGNNDVLRNKILEKIKYHSDNLNFEVALELKSELEYFDILLEKQKVELHDYISRDIINYAVMEGYLSIQIFFIRNGKLVGSHNQIIPIISDYIDEMERYIVNYYIRHEVPKEIIVPGNINVNVIEKMILTKFVYVTKGKKKKLLDMAYINALDAIKNEFELIKYDENKTEVANEELRKLLGLNILDRIDVFDNSNLFGSYAVSGMVVFSGGKPNKKEYRKYKVSVEMNDDYHTMKEVIYRRYYRALVDKTSLPNLIIVDGGINQINACKDVINELKLDIRVVGLKKDSKHRTNELVDGDSLLSYNIDKHSNLFRYLANISEEVHRFTINYHKELRSKSSISSILDNIDGLGNIRKKRLIKKYHNIKNIMNSGVDELKEIIPEKVANNLLKYLKDLK